MNSAEIRRRSALIDELIELGYDEDKLETMSTDELQTAFDESTDEDGDDVTLGIDEEDDLVDFTLDDEDEDEEF